MVGFVKEGPRSGGHGRIHLGRHEIEQPHLVLPLMEFVLIQ
jgi:hypothetical protein